MVTLTVLRKAPSAAEAPVMLERILKSLEDVAMMEGEIARLRDGRYKVRDIHAPAASGDPKVQGAVCTGCSMHGSIVTWPCPTWNAVADLRSGGAGGPGSRVLPALQQQVEPVTAAAAPSSGRSHGISTPSTSRATTGRGYVMGMIIPVA
jgi:hypothetical protein